MRCSIGLCVGVLGALFVGCPIIGRPRHAPTVPLLLVSVARLGTASSIALRLACSGRINLVSRGLAAAFGVLAVSVGADLQLSGPITPGGGFVSSLVATGSVTVLLLVLARPVPTSPFSYR